MLSKVAEHNKHFIIFLAATMEKAIEIIVGKKLERPPFNNTGRHLS